jgi:hypothetical protein
MGGVRVPKDYFYRRMRRFRFVSILMAYFLMLSLGLNAYLLMGGKCLS